MLWLLKTLQKRPSDNTIKIARIIFGLILSLSLYYNFFYQAETNIIETELLFGLINLTDSSINYVMYGFTALWIIPILMWICTKMCIAKKKYVRYIQIFFAIVLFYLSSIIVETASLDVDSLITLMAFFPLIAGITGKCITSNCMKYGEEIKKIRV